MTNSRKIGNAPPATVAPARHRRYVRTPSTLTGLSPTKMMLLRYLAECRFLALPQLARLARPQGQTDQAAVKSARRHMRTLFDAGLVEVFPVPRLALAAPGTPNDASLLYGSAPNVFSPTLRGLDTLVRAGLIGPDLARRPFPTYGPKNALFLAHELLVRDVRVWLERAAAAGGEPQGVLRWETGGEAAIPLGRAAPPLQAQPDAWFVYRVSQTEDGRETVLVGLVEVDRGTERGRTRWAEKLAVYHALFVGEGLQSATGYRNARVLVLTPDAARRDALAGLIARQASTAGLAERFWLAETSALIEPVLSAPVWRRVGGTSLIPLVGPPSVA